MKVYTRRGDEGWTSLWHGGRVRKDSPLPSAFGAVDEAQAAVGLARSGAHPGGELDRILVSVCRDLWVLMAELATDPANRAKLEPGRDLVTPDMVGRLEEVIDDVASRFDTPRDFAVPGQTRIGAELDFARTLVRRAERETVGAAVEGSSVVPYLNRLADLLWVLARWQEGETLLARSVEPG